MACAVNVVGDLLSAVFTADSAVIAESFLYLKGFAPEVLLPPVLFAFIGYFNGHEATVWSMRQGMLQVFLVRLPFSFFMSIQPAASLQHIGYAAPLRSKQKKESRSESGIPFFVGAMPLPYGQS